MADSVIEFQIGKEDPDVAYLALAGRPDSGETVKVVKQVRLSDLLAYQGPDIYLDLDASGKLLGIEVLA